MDTQHFDAVVIGSGQGGTPLAKAMANHGWRTAMVERRWIGGTCVNTGCTPTKTLVASARVAYLARRATDFGIGTGQVTVDLAKVLQRKRDLVETSRSNNIKGLEQAKDLTILYGTAAFTDPHTLSVALNDGGTTQLTAPRIFLDVGVRTTIPPIAGIEDIPTLDNETVMELEQVPRHLAILGGGYIALEFAQMFRRFGAEVTVLQHGEHVAEQEDPDISAEIEKTLRDDGITIHLHTQITAAEQLPGGDIRLSCEQQGPQPSRPAVTCSHLLIAAGRTPNTDSLAADRVGLKLDAHGFIACNDRLETSLPGVWVIGDCKGGPEFTHISYDDFRVLRDNLLKNGNHTIKDRPVPYTMFTDPELGHIGMTEKAARQAGCNIKVACMPVSSVARARESAEMRGVLKAIVDRDTDQILGASIFSVNGGELATMIQIAMMGKVTATALSEGIWSHPTWSEALNTLFSSYQDDPK